MVTKRKREDIHTQISLTSKPLPTSQCTALHFLSCPGNPHLFPNNPCFANPASTYFCRLWKNLGGDWAGSHLPMGDIPRRMQGRGGCQHYFLGYLHPPESFSSLYLQVLEQNLTECSVCPWEE